MTDKPNAAGQLKWCHYCQSNTHNDSDCWRTRPVDWKPNAAGWDNKAGAPTGDFKAPSSGSLPNTSGPDPAAPIQAESKSQYKRLATQGANVAPPAPAAPTPREEADECRVVARVGSWRECVEQLWKAGVCINKLEAENVALRAKLEAAEAAYKSQHGELVTAFRELAIAREVANGLRGELEAEKQAQIHYRGLWYEAIDEIIVQAKRAAAAEAKLASVRADTIEKCAKVCEKRAYERFGEFGTTEHDTGATYYGGKAGEIYESMDEEDDDCAKAIRALAPERTVAGKEKDHG